MKQKGFPSRAIGWLAKRLFRLAYGSPKSKGDVPGSQVRESSYYPEAIIVTTNEKRFDSSALAVVRALSNIGSRPIFVVINGNFPEGGFNSSARAQFLAELAQLDLVFPICLGDGRGMSYLWNIGIRLCGAERFLVLSDDLAIDEKTSSLFVEKCFSELSENDLVIVNDSFGHFALTWELIEMVGWFDELLLGFGEEDGDFLWRCMNAGAEICRIDLPGFHNFSSNLGFEEIVSMEGKYSFFNRAVMFEELYAAEEPLPMSLHDPPPHRSAKIPDYHQGETLFRRLKHVISSDDENKILKAVRESLEASSEEKRG